MGMPVSQRFQAVGTHIFDRVHLISGIQSEVVFGMIFIFQEIYFLDFSSLFSLYTGQTRPSFSVKQIGELIAFVKSIKPDVICMVDNCYGEFVDTIEPSDVGADMIVGSLIKNPGGGLAPIGGYIAGTKECVENASYRMTCPGLGSEVGATLGVNRSFFQGFFLAPMVTKGALKGAVFAANVYEKLGFPVIPNSTEDRQDIIQAVSLGTSEGLIAFCKGIQAAAPVDSCCS